MKKKIMIVRVVGERGVAYGNSICALLSKQIGQTCLYI